jgi:serine/threonine protein kinase
MPLPALADPLRPAPLAHPQEQEECIRETQVLALLDSPHIIRYYDSFLNGSRLFIVTE